MSDGVVRLVPKSEREAAEAEAAVAETEDKLTQAVTRALEQAIAEVKEHGAHAVVLSIRTAKGEFFNGCAGNLTAILACAKHVDIRVTELLLACEDDE